MKVKIKNQLYDSAFEPIMIIFSDEDKKNIRQMMSSEYIYCDAPDKMSPKEVEKFMELK